MPEEATMENYYTRRAENARKSAKSARGRRKFAIGMLVFDLTMIPVEAYLAISSGEVLYWVLAVVFALLAALQVSIIRSEGSTANKWEEVARLSDETANICRR